MLALAASGQARAGGGACFTTPANFDAASCNGVCYGDGDTWVCDLSGAGADSEAHMATNLIPTTSKVTGWGSYGGTLFCCRSVDDSWDDEHLEITGSNYADLLSYSYSGGEVVEAERTDDGWTSDFVSAVIHGGQSNDVIVGSTDPDLSETLYGDAGNDTVNGKAGDDVIFGNDGDDSLDGEEGEDEIWGGDGNDTIRGGEDDDHLEGGAGIDGISGDEGADYIDGGVDGDVLCGCNSTGTDGDADDIYEGDTSSEYPLAEDRVWSPESGDTFNSGNTSSFYDTTVTCTPRGNCGTSHIYSSPACP